MLKRSFTFLLLFTLLAGPVLAADDFVPEGESDITFSANNLTLDGDNTGGDVALQFGGTLSETLGWDSVNSRFSLSDDLDLAGAELVDARLENSAGSPTCDVSNLGRTYYDTVAASAYVCEEGVPGVYNWIDITATVAATASKVVTVGTGENYTTIAAAATYLNSLTGGIILLTPETHAVTTPVDLESIILIGAHPKQSSITVSGAGVMNIKDTKFQNLTINVDAALIANSAMDIKYDAATTSSTVLEWVDIKTNGTKYLMSSTAGTPPTLITRFVSPSASLGVANLLPSKASAGLNTANSLITFASQGGAGSLNVGDWDVEIAGATDVRTTGSIATTPANTIYVYPDMNLQEAINSITPGGVVTLLPGTHSITAPLTITSDNITLQGYGESSVIEATGFTGIGVTTAAVQLGLADGTAPVSDVTLTDFKLEVNNTDIHGIRAAGGTDIKLFNMTIEKTAGTSGSGTNAKLGVLLMDGATTPLVRPVMKNSKILGAAGRWFTDGIHITGEGATAGLFGNGNGVVNALLESTSVTYVGETAAAFVYVTDSSLFNNRFAQMGGNGGTAYGVYMGRINRVNMANNIVSGSLSINTIALGIESFNLGADPTTQNSVFSGNVIDGAANGGVGFGTGFQVGATGGTSVRNNIFQQNSMTGASTATTVAFTGRGDFDENIIASNTFKGGTNAWDTAINIDVAGANENEIHGNIFNNVTVSVNDNGTDTKRGVLQREATVDPAVTNDAGEGYRIGSLWVNTTADTSFILVDETIGAAVWNQIDGAGGAGHTQNTDTGSTANTFTLDNDDTGGNVSLTFGVTLAESLTWDNTNNEFDLSDDLNVGGNLLQAGNTLTLDADNTAAGANVSIVAAQGTDNNGEFRYNATTNVWEFSNDGGVFVSLNNPGDGLDDIFYAYDSAGGTLIANTPTDLPFDTEVREDTDYTHAFDSAQVTINTTGAYLVDYNCTMDVVGTARYVAEHWIERNTGGGFIEAPGTRSGTYHRTTGDGLDNASIEAYLDLNAGDIIKTVAQADATNVVRTVANGCRLKIQKLDNANGLIGPQGPQGPAGVDGTDGVSGGGWGDDGITTSTALHANITGDLTANSLTVTSECGPYGTYWAERGTVASNASWALGNGQSPWGSPMGCAGKVQRFAATCTGTIGTSLGAVIRKNNVATACSLNLSTTVGQVASTSCSETFTANDVLGVYAQTETGAWTECVGTFWVKYD